DQWGGAEGLDPAHDLVLCTRADRAGQEHGGDTHGDAPEDERRPGLVGGERPQRRPEPAREARPRAAGAHRRASAGWRSAARRAGRTPARSPVATERTMPRRTATTETLPVAFRRDATKSAAALPTRMPTTPPPSVITAVSSRNCRRMSAGRAPTARRRPISPVRSPTDASMRLAATAPPATSARPATSGR